VTDLASLQKSALAAVTRHDDVYAKDPWRFFCEQVNTVDEATQQRLPWPQDKPRLQELCEVIQAENMVAVPKSRRMMVSWLIAAWSCWRARYHPNNLILIQSEVESKSAYILDARICYIEDNLRQSAYFRKYDSWKTKVGSVGKIKYQTTRSEIVAIPQGADTVRAFTFSALIMDECEFMQEGPQSYAAAMSQVEKGAKIIIVSTSNGPAGVIAGLARECGFTRWT